MRCRRHRSGSPWGRPGPPDTGRNPAPPNRLTRGNLSAVPMASSVRDVKRHEVPSWWRDAKLGIFVHWTPASVPAFAAVDSDLGALLARRDRAAMAWSPYVEWYQNSLRQRLPDRFVQRPAPRTTAGFHGDDLPPATAMRGKRKRARGLARQARHRDRTRRVRAPERGRRRRHWPCRHRRLEAVGLSRSLALLLMCFAESQGYSCRVENQGVRQAVADHPAAGRARARDALGRCRHFHERHLCRPGAASVGGGEDVPASDHPAVRCADARG